MRRSLWIWMVGEPNDERRLVDNGGLDRVFVVGGGTIGIKRCVRDWRLVVVVDGDFDDGAVAGRGFEEVIFPFNDEETLEVVCLLRDEAIRGTALVLGTKTYNNND